jgi:DNA-binding NtrC family response regulator
MIETIIMPKGEEFHRANASHSRSEISPSHKLQALEVLAHALLKRIQLLRDSPDSYVTNLAEEVQHFEAELIMCALNKTGGRQRQAARLLGMNITTLNRKLKRYNLTPKHDANGLH